MHISPIKIWRNNQNRRTYLGQIGKLLSWSVVRVSPIGLSNHVYIVGLIEVATRKVIGQICDAEIDDLATGMQIKASLRRMITVDPDSVLVYGVKWSPLRNKK